MRFLTKESFRAPPTSEVLALIPAEQARVKELVDQGVVEAAYAAADNTAMWLIWHCESQAGLEEAHETLPMHEYLRSDVTQLVDGA